MTKPANTQKTTRHPERKTKTSWKPGCTSPNPNGRPKEGQAWTAIVREVTNLTPEEVLSVIRLDTEIGKSFRNIPAKVQMKYLIALRVIASLMDEPNASLLNVLMDREDGKVADKLEATSKLNIEGFDAALDKIYGKKKISS